MRYTIQLTGYAASEIQMRAEVTDCYDSPAVIATLKAWNGSALNFDQTNATLITEGLLELSNHCDTLSQELQRKNPDEAAANRHASRGLSTAYLKAFRISFFA